MVKNKILIISLDLDEDFKESLSEFISSVVGPNTLIPKKINGSNIKAKELILFIQEYVKILESDEIPCAVSLIDVITNIFYFLILNHYLFIFLLILGYSKGKPFVGN